MVPHPFARFYIVPERVVATLPFDGVMYARVICKDGDHDKDVHKQFLRRRYPNCEVVSDVGSRLDSVKSSEHTGIGHVVLVWEFMEDLI
jgi:hypothetical protein